MKFEVGKAGYSLTKKEVVLKVYLEGQEGEGYSRERRWH